MKAKLFTLLALGFAASVIFYGSPRSADARQDAKAAVSADEAAVRKTAADFAAAFNKGDAKAIGALLTDNAESREADGTTYRGKADIEKAYAELFKARPGGKIEVLVKSVRFPAKDMAIEEGIVRQANGVKEMPTSTGYVVIHSREGGLWKIALSSEGPDGVDRLDDLDWLLGSWTAKVKEQDVKFTFAKDAKKPLITGTFTRTPAGKEAITGSIRIAFDPEMGRIRSWGFEDDGAHSQSIWSNDGKSWLLNWRGVLADGTPASEVIVLQRAGADAITWRSIDRVLGGQRLKDTPIMKLSKAK